MSLNIAHVQLLGRLPQERHTQHTEHRVWKRVALGPAQKRSLNRAVLKAQTQRQRKTIHEVRAMAVAAEPKGDSELQVTEEVLPNCVVRLTVTVPPVTVSRAYQSVLDHAKDIEMPGFRKGKKSKAKLPEAMLVKILGGESKVKAAAVEEVLLTTLPKALEGYSDRAIDGSEAVHTDAQLMIDQFDVKSSLQYVCSVQMKPEISWKAAYTGLQVSVASAGDEGSVDQLIERELEKERRKSATLRVIVDRGLQLGDVAIVDVSIKRSDTGEVVELGERSGMQLDTNTADQTFLPGIVSGMVGMKCGETRSISCDVDDGHKVEAWRGAKVTAEVKVVELFSQELPEMNDEWASSVFPGSDIASLRHQMKEIAMKGAKEENQRRAHKALFSAVAALVDCDIPPHLLRMHGEAEYQARLTEQMSEGALTYDQAVELATEAHVDEFVEQNYQELEEAVRITLAMDAIFEEQGLSISPQDVQQEVAETAMQFKEQEVEFDEERLREQVEETLKAQAVVSWLESRSSITMTAPQILD